MRVFITGARGFIGTSCGAFAAGAGHEVFWGSGGCQPPKAWPPGFANADVGRSDFEMQRQ